MRKTFTKLCMTLALVFVGLQSGWAQFSGSTTQYPTSDYSLTGITFSLSDVAAAVGTDTATLVADLDTWSTEYSAGTIAPSRFFVSENGVISTADYNQGAAGGYWLNSEGIITTWGTTATWYTYPTWDATDDELTFWAGQFPDTLVAGGTCKATYVLEFNGQQATFDLTLNVLANPEISVVMPTQVDSANIEIVAEKSISVSQYVRTNTATEAAQIDLEDVFSLLGADINEVRYNMDSVMYAYTYDVNVDGKASYVTRTSTTTLGNDPGWWMYPLVGDDGETHTGEIVSYDYNTTETVLSFGGFTLSSDSILSMAIGQNSGVAAEGTTYTGSVLLAYNNKAVKVNVSVALVEVPTLPLSQMTEVGDTTFTITRESTLGYTGTSLSIDVDAIAALLGVESSADISFQALASEGTLTTNSTANNGGYWMNESGYVMSYGTGCYFFVEPASSSSYATLNLGTYPDAFSETGTYNFAMYFVGGTNYYELNFDVTVTVETAEVEPEDFVSVATIEEEIEIIPDATNYTTDDMVTTLDMDYIAEMIGTSSPLLYTYAAPADDSSEPTLTDSYTCTPNPGFWMGPEGYNGSWGASTGVYGMTYASGEIIWYQYPGSRSVGESYPGTFFFVNGSTGQMVTYKVTVSYVSEYSAKITDVGSEDIIIAMGVDDPLYTTVDMTNAFTALGITEEEFPTVALVARASNAKYLDESNYDIDGFMFDADGYALDANDEASALNALYYIALTDENDGSIQFAAFSIGDAPNAATTGYNSKFGLVYNNQRYVFNISLYDEDKYTGIESTEAYDATTADVISTTGVVVRKNATNLKGLPAGTYIYKGNKYAVSGK